MFGARVILNGQLLGDHLPCFTPGYFDAKQALKTGENELLIRVGADRDSVTQAIPSGFDFEKERYIPGIFDSVKLILSGTPNILNAQVVPDISKGQARVRLWLKGAKTGMSRFKFAKQNPAKSRARHQGASRRQTQWWTWSCQFLIANCGRRSTRFSMS